MRYLYAAIALVLLTVTSCDLSLQKKFELDINLPDATPFDMTAWEWLNDPTLNKGEFQITVDAIEEAGMVDYYNSKDTKDRTYLLLKDTAWTSTKGLFKALSVDNVFDIPKEKIQQILKYHMVNEYIDNGPSLPLYNTDYFFDTVLGEEGIVRGDSGVVSVKLQINYNLANGWNQASGFPSFTQNATTGRKQATADALHNYRFNNGIAHLMVTPIWVVPFQKY